jgi:hypothetical protein
MPYSQGYIDKLNLVCGDAEALIEAHGYTEDDCPVDLVPVHDNSLFKNGRPIQAATFEPRWRTIGQCSDHIDFDAEGQEVFYAPDTDAATRWHWCQVNAKGDWYVKAHDFYAVRSNERHLFVMFDLPGDDAAFLAAFPGAGA